MITATISPEQWSRDHWTTVAYAFTTLGAGGRLNPARLRLDGDRYPTRTKGAPVSGHTDLDCLSDAEAAIVVASVLRSYARERAGRDSRS